MISEIFAGTYISLQDAYAVEAAAIGSWQKIGYTGPGASSQSGSTTQNFTYKEAAASPQWSAIAAKKLNDCTAGKKWTLGAAASANNDADGSHYDVAYTAGGDGECTGLTPAFVQLTSGRNE